MASLTDLRAELSALDDQILALHQTKDGELREFTPAQQQRFDQLRAERAELAANLATHEGIQRAAQDPARLVEPNTGIGARTSDAGSLERDAAARTIDAAFRAGDLPDHAAERASALLDTGTPIDRGLAAQWASATGDPAYLRAFAALCADPQKGHLLWSREELGAYQRVAQVQSLFRSSMSLTDGNGGYMVPLTLDPAIILTSAGSINPLRRISRVVQTVTDTWQGVSSAGVTAEWKAELAEVADASPTVAAEPIPVYFGDAFVSYSFEVGQDARNLTQELGKVLVDAADQLQATAYTTGTGSGQPTGIITALTGTASEVNAATDDTFAAADIYTIQNALPPRFSANAQWCANLSIINTIDQFETTNGAKKFPDVSNGRLLNRTINELSNMDGTITTTGAVSNFVLLYGDFENFVIVDRIGTTIELIPHLFNTANNRPDGRRGALMWFRTGSDSVNNNAFRMLDVASAA
jgi:HK97 family phage major capsid protein